MNVASRDRILAGIRAALPVRSVERASADYQQIQRSYIRTVVRNSSECTALLVERLREYGAEVAEATPSDIVSVLSAQLRASGGSTFAAPPDLPLEWRVPGFEWLIDDGLSYEQLDKVDGVVTTASCAVADSGTIVLHHGSAEGRRALTLLPDWHLCVVRASQLVETLPEYFSRFPHAPQLATYISGPSATADIEMTRIKGVHGPRFLHVIILRDVS
ncbi:MAG TPA: LUD domain-containing protein [Terracidiphilus sp.]|nr:LUD domain-containing protein [Terracidiphilus sp.]